MRKKKILTSNASVWVKSNPSSLKLATCSATLAKTIPAKRKLKAAWIKRVIAEKETANLCRLKKKYEVINIMRLIIKISISVENICIVLAKNTSQIAAIFIVRGASLDKANVLEGEISKFEWKYNRKGGRVLNPIINSVTAVRSEEKGI